MLESVRQERTSVNTSGGQVRPKFTVVSVWHSLDVLCCLPASSFTQNPENRRSFAMKSWTQRGQRRETVEKMETNGSSVTSSKIQFKFNALVPPYCYTNKTPLLRKDKYFLIFLIRETDHDYCLRFKNQQAKWYFSDVVHSSRLTEP